MDREYEHILYETTDDGITTITLNRPEVRNAFNRKMAVELSCALYDFAGSDDEEFCILTGAGASFCAGEDIKKINLDAPKDVQKGETRQALLGYHDIIRAIIAIRKPIVAALNGSAAGAGLSIALACDERFAVWDEGFVLAPGFSKIGLVPDAGMIALLERFVRYPEISNWLTPGFALERRYWDSRFLFAPFYNDDEKMVETCNTVEQMLSAIKEYATRFIEIRSFAEFGAAKTILNVGLWKHLNEVVFPQELEEQVALEQGDDFREGLMAFREKRSPKFNQKKTEA